MPKQNLNEEIIRSLSGQQNWLSMPKAYIDTMGSLEGGLMLSQMIYWSNKGSRADGYFWKSYKSWKEETSLSKYQVSKQVKIMKENKFLTTKVVKVSGVTILHYKFNFNAFQKWLVKKLHHQKSKNLTSGSQKTSLPGSQKTSLPIVTSITTSTTAATAKTKKKDKQAGQSTKQKVAGVEKKPVSTKFDFGKFCKEEAKGLEAKLFPVTIRWNDNQVGFIRHSLNGGGRDCQYLNNKASLTNERSKRNGGWWGYFRLAVVEDWSAEYTYKPVVTGQIKNKYAGVRVRYQGAEHVLSDLGTLTLVSGTVAAGDVAQAITSGALEVL